MSGNREHDRARAFAESRDAMLELDEKLEILAANQAAEDLLAPATLVGAPLPNLLPSLNSILAGRSRAFEALAEWKEGRVRGPEPKRRELDLRLSVYLLEGERRAVLSLRDVSDESRARSALLHAQRELEEFRRLAVGRELRMIELKREVNTLRALCGESDRYEIVS